MKFGKLIRASVSSRMPQWEGSVLQYKRLKQAIKALVSEAGGAEPDVLVERFTTILDEEVERVNDFYMDQIEEAVIILHSLKQHIAQIVTASDAPAAHQLRVASQQSLVSFHWSLLLLQSFVVINFTAVVKILKKFDKKLGTLIGRTLRASYSGALTELPFYRCQALGGLVEEVEQQFVVLEGRAAASVRPAEQPHAALASS